MFKYAVMFLIVSPIAGAFGLTNVLQVSRRVSMALLAMFFLVFLAHIGFADLSSEATRPRPCCDPIRINRA